MARKKPEQMELVELQELRDWYTSRIKYVLYLISLHEAEQRKAVQ